MNAPALRTVLACTTLAVLTLPIDRHLRSSRPEPVTPSPAAEVGRSWSAVERQVEEDSIGYQRRVSARLHRVADTVSQLELLCRQSPARERPYLGTRVHALREHLEYARAELITLPTSTGDAGFTRAHAHFHRTIQHLDSALAQATDEMAGQ